jgi:hypothetical protein
LAVYLFELNNAQIHSTDFNYQYSHMVYNETFVVPSTFWASLTSKIYVAHEGIGIADVTITDVTFGVTTPFQRTDFQTENDNGWFALPYPLDQIASFITQFFPIIVSAVIALGVCLPVLILFYGFEAVVTAIDTMSIEPLKRAFMWLWEMLQTIYGYMIGIVTAIAEAIPF